MTGITYPSILRGMEYPLLKSIEGRSSEGWREAQPAHPPGGGAALNLSIGNNSTTLHDSPLVNHHGYWCSKVHHGWFVRTWKSTVTDQRESLIRPRFLYIPVGDIDDPDTKVERFDQSGTLLEEERKERAREFNRKKAKARAKTKCRHAIKSHDLRQLLTGTYRENMTDFDRVRRDFAAFLRSMKRYIPSFGAVYAFEQQDRGAWHWHAAIHKLPPVIVYKGVPIRSYDFVRRMWLRVVGTWDGKDNGTVNVDGHNKTRVGTPAKWNSKQSLAKIAGYVSKYLTKETDAGIEGRNMWGRTQGLDADKPVTLEFSENVSLCDMISLAFDVPEGHRVVRHWLAPNREAWCLYTEPMG